jgi:lysophospholipase L1-like esterase
MPVVAAQAVRVRRTVPVLPPASGATSGRAGPDGEPPLRVGVVGESTAAGCGVDTHDQGLAAALAREVSARSGRPVEWFVSGQHGATLAGVRGRLLDPFVDALPDDATPLDVAVLLAGVNDVLTRRDPARWRVDLVAVLERLSQVSREVLVTGVPPFGEFPSLPRTLAAYLDERAHALDAVTEQVCLSTERVTWLSSRGLFADASGIFASDGFHPSEDGYRRWAGAMVPVLDLARVTD